MRRNNESGDLPRKLLNRSYRPFAGIRARRQPPVLTHLAVQVKRQPSIQRRIVGLLNIRALLQLRRPARTVLGYRHVGNADVEEVSPFELQVAKIQRAVARIVEDRDFDAMRAGRKDFLRGEVALRVDRNLAARYPNRVAGRYAAAPHLYSAAAQRNLLARQVVLAVGGQQLAR